MSFILTIRLKIETIKILSFFGSHLSHQLTGQLFGLFYILRVFGPVLQALEYKGKK